MHQVIGLNEIRGETMTRFIPGTSLWVSSLHLSDVQHVADLISKPLHCKSLSFC